MRFLIDADLPRRTASLIVSLGHDAVDVRDRGLGMAPDEEIAAFAKSQRLCLVTGDFGFADVRNYPPQDYGGLVVLELPKNATEREILDLVREFFSQSDLVSHLPGRLAIARAGRVRFRPK